MNRLLALFITVFFATMWALLLKTELQPQGASLREVPLEHVLKLFFQHQQSSDLFVHADGERIGHLRFHPQVRLSDGAKIIEFSGNGQVRVPGAARQSFRWDGLVNYFPDMVMQSLTLHFATRESALPPPPETAVEIHLDAATRQVNYDVKVADRLVDQQSFTLDENGVRGLLERLGLDPQILQMIHGRAQTTTPPKITAHQSSLSIKSEQVETLLVTVEMNEQTMLEFHVSQLGQILRAKLLTGWTLDMD